MREQKVYQICKRIFALVLVLCLCVSASPYETFAKKAARLNYRKLTITCGGTTKKLKVVGDNVSKDGKKYTFTYWDEKGRKITKQSKITWESLEESVAVVDANGVVKTKKAGETRIYAFYQGTERRYPIDECNIIVKHKGKTHISRSRKPTKWQKGFEEYYCNRCNGEVGTKYLYYHVTENEVVEKMKFLEDFFQQDKHYWAYGTTTYNWAWKKLQKEKSELQNHVGKTIWGGQNSGKCSDWADLNVSYLGYGHGAVQIVDNCKYIVNVDGHKIGDPFDYARDYRAGDVMVHHIGEGHAQVFWKYDINDRQVMEDWWDRDGNDIYIIFPPNTRSYVYVSSNGDIQKEGAPILDSKYMRPATEQEIQELFDQCIKEILRLGIVDAVEIIDSDDNVLDRYELSYLEEPVERVEFDASKLMGVRDKYKFYSGYRHSRVEDIVQLRELDELPVYYYMENVQVTSSMYEEVYRLRGMMDDPDDLY